MKLLNLLPLLLSGSLAIEEQQDFGLNSYVIQIDSKTTMEVSFEEMLELKRQGINFMDITNHEFTTKATFDKTVFPSKLSQQDQVEALKSDLEKDVLGATLDKFTSFYTRYAKSDTGKESSIWLYDTLKNYTNHREDITVSLFSHEWQQYSAIVRIEGTENPDKIVVVGAHQDSINLVMPSLMPAPGADDDGSGAMTTLEVLRVIANSDYRPKNTIEFHWYSAEELGLLGSQDVFRNYSSSNINVRSMLQQDMTGFSSLSKQNTGHDELGVITDCVDPDLTEFIKLVVDNYCSIPYVETSCGYACSDHASALKFGYQSAFVIESAFENIDNKIHTTSDLPNILDLDHMLEHAKLTLGYAIELGSLSDL